MLTEHIEAALFHGKNIVFKSFGGGGSIDSVAEISLIKQTVEEVWLAVQTDVREVAALFHCYGTECEIGFDLIRAAGYGE